MNGVIVGGAVFTATQTFPGPTFANQLVPGEAFLDVGPSAGTPATLTFTTPIDYISFLWGSPDLYNTLTVNSTTQDSQIFTATSLGFPVTNGNAAFNQAVQFSGKAGSKITSLVFASTINSFEAGRFTVTPGTAVTAVPEPETYALMLAGLGALAFVARRRRV